MRSRPTRLLQVVTDTDRRGAQVFAAELAERLAGPDLEVRTVALARGGVGGLDVPVLGRRRIDGRTLRALRRSMAGVDVVVAHGSTTLPASVVAALGRRLPIVYRQIGDPAFWTPTWSKRLRVRSYYLGVNHVVALSADSKATLCRRFGVPAAKVTVIPNAVDERRLPRAGAADRGEARRRLGLTPGAEVVGYVGALVEGKGVADLIDAVPEGATLLVAGDGVDGDALARRAREAGVEACFLGSRDDPWDVYAASDVVALASRSEGQPAVLIEAGLVGTPVVAYRVGSIPDIVDHGATGLLVAPGDVEALNRALRRLLDEPDVRADMGGAAAERARARFAMDVVARSWRDVITALRPS